MKQLLILKSSPSYGYNISDANDLSGLAPGAIAFFDLADNTLLTSKAEKDFGIALGRPNNSPAFVIPEVDVASLSVVKAEYSVGAVFTSTITVPTVAAGNTYTVVLIKKGAVPHERNTWTSTETVPFGDTTTTASDVAAKIRKYFEAVAEAGSLDIVVSGTGANIIITGKNKGEDFVLKGADDMLNVAPTSVTVASKPIGDKAYVADLASQCAAGKGFNYVEGSGQEIYPGYPEAIDASQYYNIYTLRFKVGRKSAKTRDEKVWQLVHIAVPVGASAASDIDTILGEGDESSSSSE